MEHRKISRLLMLAGSFAVLGGVYLFFVAVPREGLYYRERYPEYAYLFIPALVFLWAIGFVYLAAMAEFFRVCRRIGQDRSFCPENEKSLSRIARLLIGAAILWLLGIPLGLLLGLGSGIWTVAFLLAAAASAAMGMLAGHWTPETREVCFRQLKKTVVNVCKYAQTKGLLIELEVFDHDIAKKALLGPAPLDARFAAEVRAGARITDTTADRP